MGRRILRSNNAAIIITIAVENRRIGRKAIAITGSALYDNYLCRSIRFFVLVSAQSLARAKDFTWVLASKSRIAVTAMNFIP
jgi:hypothetical protein